MTTALALWNQNKIDQVRALLDRYNPRRTGINEDLRGLEWYYLHHLLATGVQTWKPGGTLHAARFSPDGTRLAVLGLTNFRESDRVALFDVSTGTIERSLVLGKDTINDYLNVDLNGSQSVAFSPDGKLVAATCFIRYDSKRSTKVVKVWETDTGHEVFSTEDDSLAHTLSRSARTAGPYWPEAIVSPLWLGTYPAGG